MTNSYHHAEHTKFISGAMPKTDPSSLARVGSLGTAIKYLVRSFHGEPFMQIILHRLQATNHGHARAYYAPPCATKAFAGGTKTMVLNLAHSRHGLRTSGRLRGFTFKSERVFFAHASTSLTIAGLPLATASVMTDVCTVVLWTCVPVVISA